MFTQCITYSCQKYLNHMKNLEGFPSKHVYRPSWTTCPFQGWLSLELFKLYHMFSVLLLRPQRFFTYVECCIKSHCKRDALPKSSHLVNTLCLHQIFLNLPKAFSTVILHFVRLFFLPQSKYLRGDFISHGNRH